MSLYSFIGFYQSTNAGTYFWKLCKFIAGYFCILFARNINKKLSYCSETARRERLPKIAEIRCIM